AGIEVVLRGVVVDRAGRIGVSWTGGDRLSFRDQIKVSVWRGGKWVALECSFGMTDGNERALLAADPQLDKLRRVDGQLMVGSIVRYAGKRIVKGEKLRIEIPVADDSRKRLTHFPGMPSAQYSTSNVGQ